jgi:hypothetical protein
VLVLFEIFFEHCKKEWDGAIDGDDNNGGHKENGGQANLEEDGGK